MIFTMHSSRFLLVIPVLALASCATISSVRQAQHAANAADQRADQNQNKIKSLESQLTALQTQTASELAAINSRAADASSALAQAQAAATTAQQNAQAALTQANRNQQAVNLIVAGKMAALTEASRNQQAFNLTHAGTPTPVPHNLDVDADRVFKQLVEDARKAATKAYAAPQQTTPAPLAQLDAKAYAAINWHGNVPAWPSASRFAPAFQPEGYIYKNGVVIHLVEGTHSEQLSFTPSDFSLPADLAGKLPKTLPVAGLNFYYRFGASSAAKQFLSFLGASYFRALGQNQWWGTSARGVGIDTAVPNTPEGFPAFRSFWIMVPPANSATLTVLAQLDGANVTGAYRFVITPGDNTTMDVTATLFMRHPVKRLALAPLTSMYLQGPTTAKKYDLLHPSIHDSGGLLTQSHDGKWLWHPLQNPERLELIQFPMNNPVGYGLMQRDRNFSDYQFADQHYQDRPSTWVSFSGDWGDGTIDLVEIPSNKADDDNIVAFWEPKTAPTPGQALTLQYSVEWQGAQQTLPPLGWTAATNVARPASDTRIFSVDFTGGDLGELPQWVQLQPDIKVAKDSKLSDVSLIKLPDSGRWRLRFTVKGTPGERIDAWITYNGRPLTEDWNWGS